MNPWPARVGAGSFFPVSGSSRPGPIRRGAVNACTALVSTSRVHGGEPEPALAGAVAAVADGQVRQPAGPRLLRRRAGRPRRRRRPRGRPPRTTACPTAATWGRRTRCASSSRCASALAWVPGREVVVLVGQRTHRGHDDRGLLHIDPPGGERGPGGLEPVVQGAGQVQVGEAPRPRPDSSAAPTTPPSTSPRLDADLVAVRRHQHPQLQLPQPRLLSPQRDQRGALAPRGSSTMPAPPRPRPTGPTRRRSARGSDGPAGPGREWS